MVSGDLGTDVMRMQCIYKTAETEAVKMTALFCVQRQDPKKRTLPYLPWTQ